VEQCAVVRRRTWTVLGAIGAGLCICASMPPWGWWPLAPVGIALWLHVLGDRSVRGRFGVSWLVGVAWFAPSTLWMFQLTPPGYVVGVLLAWGPMCGVLGMICPPDLRRVVVLPAMIVLFEWFHWHAPFGGAPLSVLAYSQTRAPLLPMARLGGALLLGGAVAALGSALYLLAVRRWQPALAVVAVIAALAVGGAVWPLGSPVQTVRLAGVQGGGPQGTRYSPAQAPLVYQRHLAATRSITGPVDLVVWPENAINIPGPFAEHPYRKELAAEAARIGAPILVGVVEDVGADQFANYVVVVNPDGTLTGRYDKERRVPFGEYVPLRFLLEPLVGSTLPARDQVPGTGTAMVPTSAGPMAVAISWEIFFGRRVREGVRAGGEVVLNPTNGSSYWLTEVQTQQVAASQLRAVESGRWLLQASPTGFSAFIDPSGGVHQRTSVSERTVIERDIPRLDGTTPAQALGDVPALVLAVGALAVMAADHRRRVLRRRAADASDPAGSGGSDGSGSDGSALTPPAGA
jgi:apolipoprotein N-acyltransferase